VLLDPLERLGGVAEHLGDLLAVPLAQLLDRGEVVLAGGLTGAVLLPQRRDVRAVLLAELDHLLGLQQLPHLIRCDAFAGSVAVLAGRLARVVVRTVRGEGARRHADREGDGAGHQSPPHHCAHCSSSWTRVRFPADMSLERLCDASSGPSMKLL
jgi:hypothetical protein